MDTLAELKEDEDRREVLRKLKQPTPFLEPFCFDKNDPHFTKTGSGQTHAGNSKLRAKAFFVA